MTQTKKKLENKIITAQDPYREFVVKANYEVYKFKLEKKIPDIFLTKKDRLQC